MTHFKRTLSVSACFHCVPFYPRWRTPNRQKLVSRRRRWRRGLLLPSCLRLHSPSQNPLFLQIRDPFRFRRWRRPDRRWNRSSGPDSSRFPPNVLHWHLDRPSTKNASSPKTHPWNRFDISVSLADVHWKQVTTRAGSTKTSDFFCHTGLLFLELCTFTSLKFYNLRYYLKLWLEVFYELDINRPKLYSYI